MRRLSKSAVARERSVALTHSFLRSMRCWLVRSVGGALCLGVAAVVLTYAALPSLDLSRYEQVSTTVLARDGELLNVFLSRDHAYRLYTRIEDIDPHYIKALLALEDQWFWWHPGVNPLSLVRAASQWAASGAVVSGGSTITMQVARLLEPKARTVWHKWQEIVRAFELELLYSKREILQMYMTMVPMGGNLEGVRSASLRYWGMEPKNLSLSEVSLLLSVPQSPEVRRPDRHPENTLSSVQWVGRMLVENGVFPISDLDELNTLPFEALKPLPDMAWHFSRRVVASEGKALDALPRDELLPRWAGVLNTSLDYRMQHRVSLKIAQFARRLSASENMSVMVTNGQTGEILAYIGSLGLDSDAGYMDLTRATRSPGSTLKPFIYGMAFDDGLLTPQTLLHDTPKAYGDYAPSNFDKGHRGPVRAGVALQDSLNIPAVAVLSDLGADLFYQAWQDAGLSLALPTGADPNLGLALGAVGTRLQDLVQGYGAFVNGGRVQPLTYEKVEESLVTGLQVSGSPLLTGSSAAQITQILGSAHTIDGRVARASTVGGMSASFKTGTSYGYRDSWAVGVKGKYVIGVWVGRPDGTPVVGQTGRTVALRLASDVADSLRVDGALPVWTPEPISAGAAGLNRPPVRLIYPSNGTSVVVIDEPTPQRELEVKLSGVRDGLRVLLNDVPIAASQLRRARLAIPVDGTYELKVIDGGVVQDTASFTVISRSL
jgi:penicillin-binding protein 1C